MPDGLAPIEGSVPGITPPTAEAFTPDNMAEGIAQNTVDGMVGKPQETAASEVFTPDNLAEGIANIAVDNLTGQATTEGPVPGVTPPAENKPIDKPYQNPNSATDAFEANQKLVSAMAKAGSELNMSSVQALEALEAQMESITATTPSGHSAGETQQYVVDTMVNLFNMSKRIEGSENPKYPGEMLRITAGLNKKLGETNSKILAALTLGLAIESGLEISADDIAKINEFLHPAKINESLHPSESTDPTPTPPASGNPVV